MIDPATLATLHEIVRRESLSLLHYVGDAFPWTRDGGHAALARLRQIVDEDRRDTAGLVRYLQRRRATPPHFGSFPNWFTSINFVALDYLLPRVLDEQRQEVVALERDRTRLTDDEARSQVEQLLERKRHRLQALETLAAEQAKPVTAAAP